MARVFNPKICRPSLVSEISEHLHSRLAARSFPQTWAGIRPSNGLLHGIRGGENFISHLPVVLLTGICPLTALRLNSTFLLSSLLAAPFIHTASSETVVHRLGAWDNQLASYNKRLFGMVDSISTVRPRQSLIAQSVHSVLVGIQAARLSLPEGSLRRLRCAA